jgi:hypothetical protein
MYSERKSQRRRGCMYIIIGLLIGLVYFATVETIALVAACFMAVAIAVLAGGFYYLIRGYLPEKTPEKE